MSASHGIMLSNCDPDDILDVILIIEKSFQIRINKNAFGDARTFGDITDVILSYIPKNHKNDCTTQQAFYKIRKAIADTQLIDPKMISPGTDLRYLLPRKGRRRKVNEIQRRLGIKLDILSCPNWVAILIFLGSLASLVEFYFSWKIAICGILLCVCATKIAGWFGKELDSVTLREVIEKIVAENYIAVRRERGTVNRNEIEETIKHAFIQNLLVDKINLTRDAAF